MTWLCQHPTCDRVSKGFANGRTLCWVCKQCEDRWEKKKKLREAKIKGD